MELPGVVKEVLQKLQPNLNYSSKVLELHEILELDCLATKLFGAAGVQLQNHAKQALNNEMCFQGKMWMEKAALEKIDQHNKELARAVCG